MVIFLDMTPLGCLSSTDETMDECSSSTVTELDTFYKEPNNNTVAQEVMKFVQESQASIIEEASQFSHRMDPVFKRIVDPALKIQDEGNGMDISRNLKRARADERFEQIEGHSEIISESSSNGSLPSKKRKKTKRRKRTFNEKKWKCEICHRAFVKKGNLINHRKSHLKSPYEVEHFYCIFCPKDFTHKYKLNKHLKVHTTLRDNMFKCSFCTKRFYLFTSLIQHVLMGCICAQEHRSTVMALAQHARVMNQDERLARRDEAKRFKFHRCVTSSTKHVLARHYNTNKFQCAFCFNFFGEKTLLAEHLNSRHMNIIAG